MNPWLSATAVVVGSLLGAIAAQLLGFNTPFWMTFLWGCFTGIVIVLRPRPSTWRPLPAG